MPLEMSLRNSSSPLDVQREKPMLSKSCVEHITHGLCPLLTGFSGHAVRATELPQLVPISSRKPRPMCRMCMLTQCGFELVCLALKPVLASAWNSWFQGKARYHRSPLLFPGGFRWADSHTSPACSLLPCKARSVCVWRG